MNNHKVATETKETTVKGLIKVLEKGENIDLNKLSMMQLELNFMCPTVLIDFFNAYALFFEGITIQDFIHKEILSALESHVDLNLMDSKFGAPLLNLIQKLSQNLIEEIEELKRG